MPDFDKVADLVGDGPEPDYDSLIAEEFSDKEMLSMIRQLKEKSHGRGGPGVMALDRLIKLRDRYAPPSRKLIKVSFSCEANTQADEGETE
jgi:hypothetical protein